MGNKIKIEYLKTLKPFRTETLAGSQAPCAAVFDDQIEMWFSARNKANRSVPVRRIYSMALDLLHESVGENEFGVPGTADDSGVMPSQILEYRGHKLLFYTGWNTGSPEARYRTSICLAEILGDYLVKIRHPLLDRCDDEPIGVSMPWWNRGALYYMSYQNWNNSEPQYFIRRCQLDNPSIGKCELFTTAAWKDNKALARPVIGPGGLLWYCERALKDFRSPGESAYKFCVANYEVSYTGPTNVMLAYPYPLRTPTDDLVFYNTDFLSPIHVGRVSYV